MLYTNYKQCTSTFKFKQSKTSLSFLHSKIFFKRNMTTEDVVTAKDITSNPLFFEVPYNPLFKCRDLLKANEHEEASKLFRNLGNFLHETVVDQNLDVNDIILLARAKNWVISPTVIDLYTNLQAQITFDNFVYKLAAPIVEDTSSKATEITPPVIEDTYYKTTDLTEESAKQYVQQGIDIPTATTRDFLELIGITVVGICIIGGISYLYKHYYKNDMTDSSSEVLDCDDVLYSILEPTDFIYYIFFYFT